MIITAHTVGKSTIIAVPAELRCIVNAWSWGMIGMGAASTRGGMCGTPAVAIMATAIGITGMDPTIAGVAARTSVCPESTWTSVGAAGAKEC